jgi:hypothetical protein
MSQSLVSPSERESARTVCNRLQQVHMAFRLYPAAHPTAHRVLVDFVVELARHHEKYGSIMLRVEETELLLEDHEVYFQEEMRTNLAFLMFRDGLRFLTFHPGMGEDEAEAFVDCLAHSDELASLEHDLATALWERDLQHLEYEVADPFLGGGGQALRDDAVNDLRSTVLRRLGELNPGSGGADSAAGNARAADDGAQAALADPESVDPELVMVTEADIQSGEYAVASLDDAFGDFAVVLLEIAGFPEPPQEHDLLANALAMVVERYFELCDAQGLDLVVDRLLSLEQEGRRPREYAAGIFSEVAGSERLAQFIGSLDQAPAAKLRQAEAVLCKMRDWILPGLLELLAESSDKGVRKISLDVLEMEGGVPTEHLWPLMQDPRWYVVRNAVALATGSEHPQLLDHLEPLLRHPDARVRREVMRSADTVAGSRPAWLLRGPLLMTICRSECLPPTGSGVTAAGPTCRRWRPRSSPGTSLPGRLRRSTLS